MPDSPGRMHLLVWTLSPSRMAGRQRCRAMPATFRSSPARRWRRRVGHFHPRIEPHELISRDGLSGITCACMEIPYVALWSPMWQASLLCLLQCGGRAPLGDAQELGVSPRQHLKPEVYGDRRRCRACCWRRLGRVALTRQRMAPTRTRLMSRSWTCGAARTRPWPRRRATWRRCCCRCCGRALA